MSDATRTTTPITDPELVAVDWLDSQRSDRTREAYARGLRGWGAFITGRGKQPWEATRQDVLDYLDVLTMIERKKAGTVNGALSMVSSFYTFAIGTGAVRINPAFGIKRLIDNGGGQRDVVDADELGRMLEVAAGDGPREHLLVCVLGLNGLRISEALSLRRSSLRIRKNGEPWIAFVGKGGKSALQPLADRTALAWHQAVGLADGDAPVFPWTRHTACRVVQKIATSAAIDRNITPHGLRATFVTLQLKAGVQPHKVAQAARHSNLSLTLGTYDRGRDDSEGHGALALAKLIG